MPQVFRYESKPPPLKIREGVPEALLTVGLVLLTINIVRASPLGLPSNTTGFIREKDEGLDF